MRQSIDRVIRLAGACLLVAANAQAQYSFAVLKEFDNPLAQIQGGILRTADGTLYGSTIGGGLRARARTSLHFTSGSDGVVPSG
jgi:hypothetical protein